MGVVVGGVVPGLVRVLMGVRVVVHRVPVAMFVAVDDDLTAGIAFGAVAGGDLAGSPTFDAFFHAMGDFFDFHWVPPWVELWPVVSGGLKFTILFYRGVAIACQMPNLYI
jgi:hypothetical protein